MEKRKYASEAELFGLSNKVLLVRLAVAVGVLEERTETLSALHQQVTKNQTDITWLKRTVIGGASSLGIIGAGFGVFIKFFISGQ